MLPLKNPDARALRGGVSPGSGQGGGSGSGVPGPPSIGIGGEEDIDLPQGTIIDNMEGGSVAANYSRDTGSFAYADTHGSVDPIEGLQLLQGNHGGSGINIYSTPGDGLNHYPDRANDPVIYSYSYLPQTGDRSSFKFGLSGAVDTSDAYYLGNRGDTDEHRLLRIDGGSGTVIWADAVTIPNDVWLENEVFFGSGGSIDAVLRQLSGTVWDEVNSHNATDATHTHKGVGWHANNGSGQGDSDLSFDYAVAT